MGGCLRDGVVLSAAVVSLDDDMFAVSLLIWPTAKMYYRSCYKNCSTIQKIIQAIFKCKITGHTKTILLRMKIVNVDCEQLLIE